MTYVSRGTDESIDSLMRRFKNRMERSGVIREYKRRQRFLSAAEVRRLKARAAARRRMPRRPRAPRQGDRD